ncbi:MAG: DUF4301 family protein [Cyclobacteriaceae bacterium]
MFTDADKAQISERGSNLETVGQQIENFKNGFPAMKLEKPATDGDGIKKINQVEQINYLKSFDNASAQKSILKFVPASGAASRMFKSLFTFLDDYDGSEEAYKNFSQGEAHKSVWQFFREIENFAFYRDLKEIYNLDGDTLEEAHVKKRYTDILKVLLNDEGLGYGQLPKGLLQFHRYGDTSRTPAEEHLAEGAVYAKDGQGNVKLHFTVSPEHRSKFENHINDEKGKFEQSFNVRYEVSYSEQKSSTDTIAVDMANEPFRNDDGSLLFRPAGHGALIENLNEVEADIVFVKNIDNVVPDHLRGTTITYKKVIAAVLIAIQDKVFDYLEKIESSWMPSMESMLIEFLQQELNCTIPHDFASKADEERKQILIDKLNRPIRVCGMVPNVGDPGGGPFWAQNSDGSVSLQIVETAQIDLNNPDQKRIFEASSHFNPVDLVCGIKNYQGEKFDLTKFVDPQTGFITEKSKDGRELKAQELPGLWNGAMSDWITLFVEVPKMTFNPVKQVNDLLNDQHQPRKSSIYE